MPADATDDAPPAAALTLLAAFMSAPTADGKPLPKAVRLRILTEARRGALSMARALQIWTDAIHAESER